MSFSNHRKIRVSRARHVVTALAACSAANIKSIEDLQLFSIVNTNLWCAEIRGDAQSNRVRPSESESCESAISWWHKLETGLGQRKRLDRSFEYLNYYLDSNYKEPRRWHEGTEEDQLDMKFDGNSAFLLIEITRHRRRLMNIPPLHHPGVLFTITASAPQTRQGYQCAQCQYN